MRTKEAVIVIALMVLLTARAGGASRDDTVGASQILDEHRPGLDRGEVPKAAEDSIDTAVSVEKAISWILAQSDFTVGTLWALDQLCEKTRSKGLKELYQRELRAGRQEKSFKYYLKLFDNEVTLHEIPESRAKSRSGLMIMEDWLIAAANCEDFAPSEEVLRELFENRYSGYLSTHQLLAIMWLRDQGYLDERIEPRIRKLVEQMVLEQAGGDEFTDLFVERVAFIFHAGYGEKVESRWIKTILDAQKEDGSWRSPPPEINAQITDLHTTILAVWALAQHDGGESDRRITQQYIFLDSKSNNTRI